ncbi:hypothetical protein [Klebsiella pneumoniae]
MTKEILAVPGMPPSPLFKRTYKAVQDTDEKLTKLIHRWRFLNAGPPMKVTAYDGTEICYQGVAFKGSPVQVFWNGFIEPYIENHSINIFEQTSALAIECQFSIEESIEEAKSLLLVMVRRLYHEMAETDRILRGDGFSLPKKKDISGYIKSMSQKIIEHADIEKLKKPLPSQNIFNIDTVNSKYAQFGSSNNISTQEMYDFFKVIASSGDDEVIVLSKLLLSSACSKKLLSNEKHDFLISVFKP